MRKERTEIMWGIDSGWHDIPMCLNKDKAKVVDDAKWYRKIWKAPKEFRVVKVIVSWVEEK